MLYAVPLCDGSYGFVQAIAAAMANVIDITVLSTRSALLPTAPPATSHKDVIALLATWRQDLNGGYWAALGASPLIVNPDEMPNQKLIAMGTTVGIKHSSCGLVSDLLNAWHGLAPWNTMHEENYFDSKLAPGVRRPRTAIVLTPMEREAYRAQLLQDT
jgi:hypothetical protein